MKKTSPISRGGRFASGPQAEVARFTESVSFDWRLWEQDIIGSMAQATMLQKAGLLTKAELKAIMKGLESIGQEIADGRFQLRPVLDDVDMNIAADFTR